MEKRYQVFVSSTYEDLKVERNEVLQALLEIKCIPLAMELFPAADDDQLTLIKRAIDECDYYVVLVAGRYGSIGKDQVSYTELEYRYALEQGKPLLGFVHRHPEQLPINRCEQDSTLRSKLESFRQLVQQKSCKFWTNEKDLRYAVSISLISMFSSHPAVGWVRGDTVGTAEEVLSLHRRIEELEAALSSQRHDRPKGTDNLAQGNDILVVRWSALVASEWKVEGEEAEDPSIATGQFKVKWNDLFAFIGPKLIFRCADDDLRRALRDHLENLALDSIDKQIQAKDEVSGIGICSEHDLFDTIKIQWRALGLMVQDQKVKASIPYWTLTAYGDHYLTTLRALTREGLATHTS